MTSNLAMVSARPSNESIRIDRMGTLKEDSDNGGVSYVFPRTTCYANSRTRNVTFATPRQRVRTTVPVGGQDTEDDGEGQ